MFILNFSANVNKLDSSYKFNSTKMHMYNRSHLFLATTMVTQNPENSTKNTAFVFSTKDFGAQNLFITNTFLFLQQRWIRFNNCMS